MEWGGGKAGGFFEVLHRHRVFLLVLILFLAILGAYYPSLFYPFIDFDDPYYIRTTPISAI